MACPWGAGRPRTTATRRPTSGGWIRDHANVVLTNPDLLHHSLLPGHERWSRFPALRWEYVVVDECHVYRGVFGSHVVSVLRRLRRVARPLRRRRRRSCSRRPPCRDPAAHAARLIGHAGRGRHRRRLAARGDDLRPVGAAAARRRRAGAPVRRRRPTEAAELLADLVARRACRTVAFVAQPRRGAESLAANARRLLGTRWTGAGRPGRGIPGRVPARGAARTGGPHCAPAGCSGWPRPTRWSWAWTSAGLDAVLIAGWPGRRTSMWQQVGRAGRAGEESLAVLVAADDPLDTYLVRHPEAIFGGAGRGDGAWTRQPARAGPAPARPPPRSCRSARATCRCSGPTPRRLLDALVTSGILRRRPSGWFWAREDRPAEHISLRGAATRARSSRPAPAGAGHRRRGVVARAGAHRCRARAPGRHLGGHRARPRGPRGARWCAATPGGRRTRSR